MSDKVKTQSESRWRRYALIAAVVLFMASTAWNIGTRVSTQSKTTSSIEATVEATETICMENEALAHQYKVRAEDEIILTEVALLQTYSAIAFAKGLPGNNQDTIEEFESTLPGLKKILNTIHILPPPDCKKQGERLRATLPPG